MRSGWGSRAVGAAVLLVAAVGCSQSPEDSERPSPPAVSTSLDASRDAPVSNPTPQRTPFAVDLPGTQPRWDPRKVDDLPLAGAGIVPGLPAVIDPPATAPALADAPIDAAVLAVEMRTTALLLSPAGEWRSVPLPDDRYGWVSLSPDGRRLLVDDGDPDEDPVTVVDVRTGATDRFPYPRRYRGGDYASWQWLSDDELLLVGRGTGWAVDVDSGGRRRVPYPTDHSAYGTPDLEGSFVEGADWTSPRVLTDWSVSPPREVSMRPTGRLSHLVAGPGTIVATSYDGHPFSVVVADRATLEPSAVLPVLDFEGNYSPGALRPIALQDDGTVLLKVSVFGRDVDGFRLVAWEPRSGDLAIAATTDLPLERSVSFAQRLLSTTDP